MSTEERDESQPRPRKVIPSIRRENTDQDSERRPYNQGYNRPEGNNYERRPYNRGGYNSYGDNRSYGDRPSRPRTYDNRDGGYNKPYNRDNGGNRSVSRYVGAMLSFAVARFGIAEETVVASRFFRGALSLH